ncbi:hypothetical protein NG99_20865 [Erwinia typographi]|uniref:Uncharacterized protein n=1 Tax=Erwinia typographi TaxID=371042 RepID=A0A0A3ZTD3_9GAMM|nr:hypothetical protein NG99_20865 [Erwinia typographi]
MATGESIFNPVKFRPAVPLTQRANSLINDTFYNLFCAFQTLRKASFTPGTRNAHTLPDKI